MVTVLDSLDCVFSSFPIVLSCVDITPKTVGQMKAATTVVGVPDRPGRGHVHRPRFDACLVAGGQPSFLGICDVTEELWSRARYFRWSNSCGIGKPGTRWADIAIVVLRVQSLSYLFVVLDY